MRMTTRGLLNAIAAATIALMCSAAQARASAIQLTSPSDLSAGGTVVTFPNLLSDPLATPEPGALVLLGSGLLYGASRLRRRTT